MHSVCDYPCVHLLIKLENKRNISNFKLKKKQISKINNYHYYIQISLLPKHYNKNEASILNQCNFLYNFIFLKIFPNLKSNKLVIRKIGKMFDLKYIIFFKKEKQIGSIEF